MDSVYPVVVDVVMLSKFPLLCTGFSNWLDGLKTCFQLFARTLNFSALAESPSEEAKRERAKSALSYSIRLETVSRTLQQPRLPV